MLTSACCLSWLREIFSCGASEDKTDITGFGYIEESVPHELLKTHVQTLLIETLR